MKDNKIKRSKILKISKVVSIILIILSISEFYFERVTYLEQAKKWDVDLIEKGEIVYKGNRMVWSKLSDNRKEDHRLNIKLTVNRIKFNNYLIIEHMYNLILDIVLFVSLFILDRWVKLYLIFWVSSGILFTPIYYSIIGYDSLLIERFALFNFEMKITLIIIITMICAFYFLSGRHIFKLIDLKNAENN